MLERYAGPGLVPLQSRFWLSFSLAARGDLDEAMAVAVEAHGAARTVEHPYSFAFAEYALGRLHVERGAFEAAVAALERARALMERREIEHLRPAVEAWLGYALARSGGIDEGLALLRRAADAAAGLRRHGHGRMITCLAESLLLAGCATEGVVWAERGLDLTRRQRERGHEAIALGVLGTARAALGDPAGAERCYHDALALAQTLGMRPVAAQCQVGLGRLHAARGHDAAAAEAFARAAESFAAMRLPEWVDRVKVAAASA